jgi:AraC-like DNA-binding protein
MTAETASHALGYASPWQFNREFKRPFRPAPAAEKKRMRESFAIPHAFANSDYVASH